MPAPRRKAPRQQAPQTIDEATALLGRYAEIVTSVETLRADADESIARIEAARDAIATPLEEEAKDIFSQLRAWWAVAGDAITEGKRKSAEIAGCLIGERTTTPKLALAPRMTEASAIAWLELNSLFDLVRIKKTLDKPALLTALKADTILGRSLAGAGFSPGQKDEFFIDRAGPKPGSPEAVQLEEAA